jgi:hypothetical protein
VSEGRHIKRGQPTDSAIKQHSIELRDDENADGTLHAKGANCETPVIHEHGVHFNLAHAVASAACSRGISVSQRKTFRGAHTAATWFERLVVAQFTRRGGRSLQQRLAETNLNPGWSEKQASETAVIFQFLGIGE